MPKAIRTQMDMTTGPFFHKIIVYTLPIIATSMMQLLFNSADLVVVGRFGSENSVGAVGATSAIVNLLINLFIGLSVGVSVCCAQCYGAGNKKGYSETVHTAVVISLIAGAIVGTAGFFLSEQLLRIMSTPEDIIGLSSMYLKIYFLGMPGVMLFNYMASALRAVGNTKSPMIFLFIAGLLNVVLNLIFVILFNMDVAGVALATVITQYLAAALILLHMLRTGADYKLNIKKLKITWDKLKRIFMVGIPSGLHYTIFSFSNVLIQSSLNTFASVAVTGSSAAMNIETYVYFIQNGFYQASLNFTGQNFGAGKHHQIPKVLGICLATVTAVGIVAGNLAYLFGPQLLSIYIPGNEAAIAFGMERILMICCPYFICGIMDVTIGCLRGMNYSVSPMLFSIIGVCGTRILWILTVFQEYHTLTCLYMSYPVSWFIAFAAQIITYWIVRRKMKIKPPETSIPQTITT